jgi:hypothetical protein
LQTTDYWAMPTLGWGVVGGAMRHQRQAVYPKRVAA